MACRDSVLGGSEAVPSAWWQGWWQEPCRNKVVNTQGDTCSGDKRALVARWRTSCGAVVRLWPGLIAACPGSVLQCCECFGSAEGFLACKASPGLALVRACGTVMARVAYVLAQCWDIWEAGLPLVLQLQSPAKTAGHPRPRRVCVCQLLLDCQSVP